MKPICMMMWQLSVEGASGNDGDGILMALAAGANPCSLEAYPMGHQRMGFDFVTKFDIRL